MLFVFWYFFPKYYQLYLIIKGDIEFMILDY